MKSGLEQCPFFTPSTGKEELVFCIGFSSLEELVVFVFVFVLVLVLVLLFWIDFQSELTALPMWLLGQGTLAL